MTKLKQLIKLILFFITDSFIPKKAIKKNTLLLIRLDAIGDYVLFRNYIEILKNESPEYKITLVGNIAWKSIAQELDFKFIDRFIWIDTSKFSSKFFYRFKKIQEITAQGYERVINPTYSRIFYNDDSIVRSVNAKEKIGNSGDLSNSKKWQKNISDKYYTKLIPAQHKIIFEFLRNREFFENLFDKKLDIKKPSIKLKDKKLNFELPKKYAILFIGASASYRKWNVEKFVEVGKYIKKVYNLDIVVCGGPTDMDDAKKFKKFADYDYVDMVGKTSLVDFLYIIYNGNLMLSNETSAPHFAVALEMTNIFVIYNGNHYGRFTPYPQEVSENYHVIYHPEIEKDLNNYKKLSNSYGYGSKLDINEISIDSVKNKIKGVLK